MILIRPYADRDSAQLSGVINQVCADTPWMATRSFIPTNPWVHAMESTECRFHSLLVAEHKGDVVGWCRSFPTDCEGLSALAEIGIGLLAQYRDRGIGSELIMRSLEWANAIGMRIVKLTVSSQNSIAIHVFMKCGFETLQMNGSEIEMSVCVS